MIRVMVMMAAEVGARGVLVRTGHGERDWRQGAAAFPDGTQAVMNLMAATVLILTEGAHASE